MTEKELISKVRLLRKIKPRKDWVVFTKKEIVGEEPKIKWSAILDIFSAYKPVFAGVISVFVFLGLFVSAQGALPGDFLYPLKKITEKTRAVFVSKEELPKVQLELANKRLEEITRIAQENQVKKLAPALDEYQASVVKAAQNLIKTKDSQNLKDIVQQTKKIEENKQKIEALGVVIDEETEDLNNAMAQIVEREIKNLENQILTEEQQKVLEEVKVDFEAKNYNQALEKILSLSYPQI